MQKVRFEHFSEPNIAFNLFQTFWATLYVYANDKSPINTLWR